MPDVMLDIETMGQGPDAAIIAIGAVEFDIAAGTLGDSFYRVVDLASSVAAGGVVDADTVLWWMRQDDAARAGLAAPNKERILSALYDFSDWLELLGERKTLGLWGNGAGFDNVILASAYRRAGLRMPWDWWNDRCYRTVKALNPGITLEREGTAHNALDDARHQARHLIAILRGSGLGRDEFASKLAPTGDAA